MTAGALAERYALCEARVTLNGSRAKVTGARREFARVTDVATGLSAEWSWRAVALIVSRGGAFRT